MKKGLILAFGFFLVSAGLWSASAARILSVEFTLVATGGGSAPISFTLAPRTTEPTALAGPGGLGVIEDPGWPYRTALGYEALKNSSGGYNTAIGFRALTLLAGQNNTALGSESLGGFDYTSASSNNCTAVGFRALGDYKGGQFDTALGAMALFQSGSGPGNTAIGYGALEILGEGLWDSQSYNTALGYMAGSSLSETPGEGQRNYNIHIGANQKGERNDTNTIRIGTPREGLYEGQNRTFIAGIVESPLIPADEPSVVGITSEGRLGTMSSDLLPPGPQGPQGIQGPQGVPGEGLVPGSLLFMLDGSSQPEGYVLLGRTTMEMATPNIYGISKVVILVYIKGESVLQRATKDVFTKQKK